MGDEIDRLKTALADRYDIEREIGRGVATVYLAEDRKLGRQVALWVLRHDVGPPIHAEHFLRKIEIAATLNHPHILPLLDSGRVAEVQGGSGQEILYYTVPCIEGESLRDRLNREKQLPVDDAIQIAKEVADALSYAHSHGVVHSDIKPENILFTAGHAVVSDFGIARTVTEGGGERLADDGFAVGTPEYMSPEQGAGSGEPDARSDIYSLGCVLYEMLAGETPYTASTPQALIAKKQSEPTPRISVVRETAPAVVEAALIKALEKNPADRFATAQQFAEALSERVTPVGRVAGRGKRSAWQWVAGVGALFAIVAAGVVLSMSGRSGADTAIAEGIDRLVVAPLENRTGDPAASDWGFLAAEYVTRALDRAAVVTVVPARSVRDLVREADATAGMTLSEIARRTGAHYAVAGSYSLSGDQLRFDVELVNTESGELERPLDPVAGPANQLEAVFTLLAERITATTMARLSPDLGPGMRRLWSSPPSVDAVQALLAVQELFCATRYPEAIDVAQSALEVTPGFAPLLLMSSIALQNVGRLREADSVLALIEPFRGQLTSLERSLADWHHARLRGDHAGWTQAVEQLYRIRPGGYGYHAGFTAMRTNRFTDALERFLSNDTETPCYRRGWAALWSQTASAYHMLGRYREELEHVRRGLERFPGHRPLTYFESIALAGLGRLDALDSLLDDVADLPPQRRARNIYSPGSQAAMVALELNVLGQPEASERVMERALAWFAALPADSLRFERGQLLYWAEHWSGADTLFAALIQDAPNDFEYRGYRAVALAHLGRREEALESDQWLEKLDRLFLRGAHTRWRAAIAAALGNREDAVRLLQQAYGEGMDLGYYFRRDPEWRPLYDYRPYEEFVRAR